MDAIIWADSCSNRSYRPATALMALIWNESYWQRVCFDEASWLVTSRGTLHSQKVSSFATPAAVLHDLLRSLLRSAHLQCSNLEHIHSVCCLEATLWCRALPTSSYFRSNIVSKILPDMYPSSWHKRRLFRSCVPCATKAYPIMARYCVYWCLHIEQSPYIFVSLIFTAWTSRLLVVRLSRPHFSYALFLSNEIFA